MPATTDELTYARSYIGSTESEDTFNERVDRLERTIEFDERINLIDAAIEESLRAQLAEFATSGPAQASIGSLSQSVSGNLQTLSQMLKDFQATKGSKAAEVTKFWRQPTR